MMANYLRISCDSPVQHLDLELYEKFPDMSSVDFAKCQTVFEDGCYKFEPFDKNFAYGVVKELTAFVNGEKIGQTDFSEPDNYLTYYDEISGKKEKIRQPFLLQYDLVVLSIKVVLADGQSIILFSDFLICVSKNQEDTENIRDMVQELTELDDGQIGEWIFSCTNSNKVGLHEGSWHHYAYKSLSSYVQLLEKVSICYKDNFAYFRTKGKHTITKKEILSPYSRVKAVTRDSFNWLMQNLDQLSSVPSSTGIQYRGNYYVPLRLKTDIGIKGWDIYENRIIVSFLYTVLNNAQLIYREFDQDILNEERIILRIQNSFPREYHAPIITVKSLQVSFARVLLGNLFQVITSLNSLFVQYRKLFDIPVNTLISLPRRTKTFQEIGPYSQVFEIVLLWFKYGEFSLAKNKLILQVKTLDKLFEYYCLIKLLDLFASHGYQKADVAVPAYKHEYNINDGFYQNEKDVANTYILQKNDIQITLYYQPVISSLVFDNNLGLYRTTRGRNYFTPDFVVKFTHPIGDEDYAIFDSKFSPRRNIKKHSLKDVLLKYFCQVASKSGTPPKMIWILQGRVNTAEKAILRYYDSPLAEQYRPTTSCGIVSMNTKVAIKQRLWDELKGSIPWID